MVINHSAPLKTYTCSRTPAGTISLLLCTTADIASLHVLWQDSSSFFHQSAISSALSLVLSAHGGCWPFLQQQSMSTSLYCSCEHIVFFSSHGPSAFGQITLFDFEDFFILFSIFIYCLGCPHTVRDVCWMHPFPQATHSNLSSSRVHSSRIHSHFVCHLDRLHFSGSPAISIDLTVLD